MYFHFSTGQRNFHQSPIPISQRNYWEVFVVHQGRFGMVFPNHSPIYNTMPTVWVLGPDLFHGKIGDGSICEIARFSCPKMHPWIEHICPRDQFLKLEYTPAEMQRLLDCPHWTTMEQEINDPLSTIREELSFLQLCVYLLEKIPKNLLPNIQSLEHKRIQSAFLWYEEHMELDPDLHKIAASIHLSESHFRRIVRDNLKKSAQEVIQELKMTKAKGLLAMNYSIEKIALACGYGSSAAFSRAFKRINHIAPLAFRQNLEKSP
jgi:AraC-like DNA-binding protein